MSSERTQAWQSARHNRPDGTLCPYVAGFVCNKCGTVTERRSGERRKRDGILLDREGYKHGDRLRVLGSDRRSSPEVPEGSTAAGVGGVRGSEGSLALSASALAKFAEFRALVFAGIKRELEEDGGGCKSFEGAIQLSWPNYFDDRDGAPEGYGVHLDCYVIGPNRHYYWLAGSHEAALDCAIHDVRIWIEDRDERTYWR